MLASNQRSTRAMNERSLLGQAKPWPGADVGGKRKRRFYGFQNGVSGRLFMESATAATDQFEPFHVRHRDGCPCQNLLLSHREDVRQQCTPIADARGGRCAAAKRT